LERFQVVLHLTQSSLRGAGERRVECRHGIEI
jgi:hypothetical protein